MTRTLRLAAPVLALLLAAPTAAQKVTGRVLPPPGGKAVASAKIQVELTSLSADFRQAVRRFQGGPPPILATARPRPDGSFEIAAPEPGLYRVTVRAEGFVPVRYELSPLVEDTELPPVALRPAVPVEVQVLAPDGKPAPGVPVQTVPLPVPGEPRPEGRWQPAGKVDFTGADGRVTGLSLPGARLWVLALAQRFSFPHAEVRERSVMLRLKAARRVDLEVRDARGRKAAGAIVRLASFQMPLGLTGPDGRLSLPLEEDLYLVVETEAGQNAGIRLAADTQGTRVVELEAPATVTGRALEAAGRSPVAGGLVWAEHTLLSLRPARTTADGTFQIQVHNPRALLHAAAPGYQRDQGQSAGPSEEGGAPAPVTFLLPRAGLIAGRVVDTAGKPVAGAKIRTGPPGPAFDDNPDLQAWSGADGSFRLPRLTAGETYELEVRKEGFAPGSAYGDATAPGKPATPVRVVLSQGGVAFGRVADEAGRPVAGAEVEALPLAEPRGMLRLMADLDRHVVSGTSRADGLFEIRHLPAGLFTLQARAPGFAHAPVPAIEIPAAGGRVDLGTLTLSPEAVLEGLVTDPRGAPLAGARIGARPEESLGGDRDLFAIRRQRPVETGADGRFRITGFSPGAKLRVNAMARGYTEAILEGVETPPPAPLRIELRPLGKLVGRVVDRAGEPVPRALVRVIAPRSSGYGSGSTDDQGRFRIDVEPGPVELKVQAEGYTAGSWRGEMPARGEGGPAEVTLERGAVLEGRVLDADGNPFAGAEVSAYPDRAADMWASPANAESDADGRFRLTGLETGLHRVQASVELEGATASASFEVQPGVNRLDLTLEEGLEVAGSVRDAAGAPVAGAEVSLALRRSGRFHQKTSAADGSFRFQNVKEGPFFLRAQKRGLGTAEQEIEVAGQSLAGIDLRLAAGGTITGRLLGLRPADLAGVRVRSYREGLSGNGMAHQDGTYRIGDLAPGDWTVVATLPSGRQTTGRVTLEPGAPEAVLDLDLGGDLTLSGVARIDGVPASGTMVSLHASETGEGTGGQTGTGSDGGFRMTRLTPGTYTLMVQVLNSGPLMILERQVELAADQEIAVEVVTGKVQGQVVTPEGAPVAGARISLKGDHRGWTTQSFAEADGQGRFELRLPAGEYRLRANTSPDNPETPVQVPAGGIAVVPVTVQPESR